MLPKNFQKKTKSPNDNLTQTDKNFIKQFSKRNDLVMTKADKGGAGVILDIKDYVAKADEQLEGNSFYQKVNVDPIAKYSENLKSATENFRKQELLSNSIANKLTIDEVRTAQFHTLPKVHNPNIPRRSVVISVECHTSKILKFVDHLL